MSTRSIDAVLKALLAIREHAPAWRAGLGSTSEVGQALDRLMESSDGVSRALARRRARPASGVPVIGQVRGDGAVNLFATADVEDFERLATAH